MWHSLKEVGSVTNTVTLPHSGLVGINLPHGVELSAYVNDVETPIHHLHVHEGDTLHFKLEGNKSSVPTTIDISYDGGVHKLDVAAIPPVVPYSTSAHSERSPHKEMEKKMTTLSEQGNIFGMPNAFGSGGAGVGAAVGGFLGAAVGRNGNLFGGGNGTDVSGLNNLQGAIDTNAILSNLADIKAAVPLAESQVQLALAGVQNDINNQSQAQSLYLGNLLSQDMLATQKGFCDLGNNVSANGTANLLATKDAMAAAERNSWQLSQVVTNDGEKTRALIARQYEDTLNRQLTDAKNEVIELRGDRRIAEATGNITITNTNTANAIQSQNQAQQQFQILAQLAAQVQNLAGDIQSVRQATSNVNFGVQGANTQTNSASNNRVS